MFTESILRGDWQELKGIFEGAGDADPFEAHLKKVASAEFFSIAFPYLQKKYGWTRQQAEDYVSDPEITAAAIMGQTDSAKEYFAKNPDEDPTKIILYDDNDPADPRQKAIQEYFALRPDLDEVHRKNIQEYWLMDKIQAAIKSRKSIIANQQSSVTALKTAASFQDILDIFKKAFGSVVNQANIETLATSADKLKSAITVLRDNNSDPEARYFAFKQMDTLGRFDVLRLAGVDSEALNEEFGEENRNKAKALLTGYTAKGAEIFVKTGMVEDLNRRGEIAEQIKTITEENQRVYEETKAPFEVKEREANELYQLPLLNKMSDMDAEYRQQRKEIVAKRPGGSKGSRELTPDEEAARRKWVEEVDAFDADYSQRQSAAARDVRDARNKYIRPILDEKYAAISAAIAPYSEQLKALNDENTALANGIYEKVIIHLLEQSPVTEDQAAAWIKENALIDKKAIAKARKAGYAPEDVQKDLAQFYRITGGRLPRLEYTTIKQARSAAAHWNGKLFVGSSFGKRTFFHELAHLLEDDPKIVESARAFLEKRRESDTVYSLSSLTGNTRYKSGEGAYKDTWHDPYVGKFYSNSTEVFSMGMQMLSSPDLLLSLQEKDPEHLAFMLGMCATKPYIDDGKTKVQQGEIQKKKTTAQKTENITKDLDKKIAAAGDFWTAEGVTIEPYTRYGKSRPSHYYVYWPHENRPGYNHSQTFKSEKVMKRAIYLWIAKGKPEQGSWALFNLSYQMGKKDGGLPEELLNEGVPTLSKG